MITIASIQRRVAERYGLPRRVMLKSGGSRVTEARRRQIAMVLARRLTHHSRNVIGQRFGGRDPTTIYHAEQAIAARRQADPALDRDIRMLTLDLLAPQAEAVDCEPADFIIFAGQSIRRDALPSFPRAGAR